MTRSTRPSGKAAQLELVTTGETTVQITRPDAVPINAITGWTRQHTGGRQSWHRQANPLQSVRVSYEVFRDPVMLADLCERSARNRNGKAIRGLAEAQHGKLVNEGLTPRAIAGLVQHAANLSTLRTSEGPASVRVRLLEPLEPFETICAKCKATFAEHEVLERLEQGDWTIQLSNGNRGWDSEAEKLARYYLCPIDRAPVTYEPERIRDDQGVLTGTYEVVRYQPDGTREVLDQGLTFNAAYTRVERLREAKS